MSIHLELHFLLWGRLQRLWDDSGTPLNLLPEAGTLGKGQRHYIQTGLCDRKLV